MPNTVGSGIGTQLQLTRNNETWQHGAFSAFLAIGIIKIIWVVWFGAWVCDPQFFHFIYKVNSDSLDLEAKPVVGGRHVGHDVAISEEKR